MSETDSFIDEVSEEVRRDRLYGYLRRYGWIGVLAVILIVGGAAWNEFRKARVTAAAEALGDAVLTALESEDAATRRAALDAIEAEGPSAAVIALLSAAEKIAAEEPEAAAEELRPLALDTAVSPVYSDMAALKLVLLGDAGEDATTRAQLLERLAQPGAPYRLLALEQQALALAADGDSAAAIAAAQALLQEDGVTGALRQRISQLIVALGGTLPELSAG